MLNKTEYVLSSADGAKFTMGKIAITKGAMRVLKVSELNDMLHRHSIGDWGEVSQEDKFYNDRAVVNGEQLMSAHHIGGGQRIWIITEKDRSTTKVLLPSEY